MSSKWKLEKRYESGKIKPKLCSYRPGGGNSTLVHLFGFVASNGGADAADINGGDDAADNDTTMQATFLYTNLILVVKVNATRSRPIH